MYELTMNPLKGIIKLKRPMIKIVERYMLSLGKYKTITEKRRVKISHSLDCFIANTMQDFYHSRSRTLISLDYKVYSNKQIINGYPYSNKVSLDYTKLIIAALVNEGWITFTGGGKTWEWFRGKMRCIDSSCSYVYFCDPLKQAYRSYKSKYIKQTRQNVIVLRDENKQDITFRMTEKQRLVKEYLDCYNLISLDTPVKSPDGRRYDVQLGKVYNTNFTTGARSYMSANGIQSLTKEERYDLTIKDTETVIYDLKSFEPSLAYSYKGIVMIGDPYQLEWVGYEKKIMRTLGKMALTTMLYAEDRDEAIAALNYEIGEELDVDKLFLEGKIPDKVIPIRRIVSAMETKHERILDLLYNPSEVNLAYMGSLIVDYVTSYFMQRKVIVLPIFDEFIIQEQYEKDLIDVIREGYSLVMGNDVNCKIRKEK